MTLRGILLDDIAATSIGSEGTYYLCIYTSYSLIFVPRALCEAINFFGKRMTKDSVVWHGLSQKMVFSEFAPYFDCPTSTTTKKNIAMVFAGNGSGLILKLKSKFKDKCAFMLDVSVFSNFTV